MYTLDTIKANIEYSKEGSIKTNISVMNVISQLRAAGRNTFTADDITYILNRSIKMSWNKVTTAQVERVIKTEVRHNERGEIRRGYKTITALRFGFYQYGR